jgi:fibronectin-binding autotransporter adhesin
MAAKTSRRRQNARTLALLAAALAGGGVGARFSQAQTYTYTGPGGSTVAPTSGNFSDPTAWTGGAPTPSNTTELDFLDQSSAGYTATDDDSGIFTLNYLVLGNNTTNTDTIAAVSGSSLYFSGASTTIAQAGSGSFVLSAPIGIDPSDTLTFGGTGTGETLVTGSIGGGAGNSVTVAGANTVVFAASNSYAGALNVNSGILNIQNSGAISGAQGYVNSGATLQLQNNITESAPLQLTGAGATGQNGALVNTSGTNTVTGNVTFAGQTTISSDSGTLIFSTGSFVDNNVLTLTGAGNGVFNSGYLNIDGHAGFYLDGTGTWYFNDPSPYFSGSIHLNSGTLNFVKGGLSGFFINPGGGVLQYAANTASPDDLSGSIGYGPQGAPVAIDTNGNIVTFASSPNYNLTGGLIKYGAGALIFDVAYQYSGATTIAGGTLQIGNGGTVGGLPGNSTIADSGNFTIDESSSLSQGTNFGTLTGNGSLSMNGGGTATLYLNNTYTGSTNINLGTLQAGSNQAFGTNSAVILADAANTALNTTGYNNTIGSLAGGGTLGGNVVLGSSQLTIGSDNTNTTFAGAISGTGSISKTGNGTLTLTGSSTFTGAGNVSSGVLNLQNSFALGPSSSSTFAVFSGTTLQLQGGITLPSYTIQVAGTGASTQDGAIVNEGGTNTITGLTNVAGAGAGATTISSDSGTLVIAGGITTGGNNLTVSGAGNGVFANSGNVNFTNSNFVEKDGTGAWDFANGSATFAGNLHLNSGTVSFVSGGLGGTTINANGGVLKYDTGNTQDVSGVGGSNPTIQYGNAPIAIDTNGNNVTFNGTLTNNNGSQGLIKYGAGQLILNAATDYGANNTTVTSVLGGALIVNGSTPGSAQGQYGSTVTVGNGTSSLSGIIGGTGTIGGSLTVQYGGTITAGSGARSSDTPGTLTLNGVTFNSGGTYAVKIGAGGVSDELITPYYTGPSSPSSFVIQVTGTGSATYSAGEQWVIADNTSGNNSFDPTAFVITSAGTAPPAGDFSLSNASVGGSEYDLILTANSVPEPTSLSLLGLGGLALMRRRRSKQTA